MAKKKRNLIKLQCSECGNINYYIRKSQEAKALGTKIALKKFCKHCRKHTLHKEVK